MTDLGTGLHTLTRAQYDALDRVNFSTLKLIGTSPAHYQHRMKTGDSDDTDARARGRCVHLAVLEPEKFREQVVVWDGGTRRGKDWESFKARNAEKEILKPEPYEEVITIAKAVRGSDQAARYLVEGRSEVAVLWDHVVPEMGGLPGYRIRCKALLDRITPVGIIDLKSTRDASPDGFGRECANYESHVQASFYSDGYRAATGKELPYILIATEAAPPHVVQAYRVREDDLENGRETYRGWLDRLDMCRREQAWPGYSTTEMDLVLPPWATPQDDNDVSGLGLTFSDAAVSE